MRPWARSFISDGAGAPCGSVALDDDDDVLAAGRSRLLRAAGLAAGQAALHLVQVLEVQFDDDGFDLLVHFQSFRGAGSRRSLGFPWTAGTRAAATDLQYEGSKN